MNRLTVDEYGCLLTLVGKARSEDHFTQCSAVAMAPDHRILGVSYNGLPAGIKVEPWMKKEENRLEKNDHFIHAEANLCSLFQKGDCETVYINISPCLPCAHLLAAHGVKRVVYLKEYHRCTKFKKFFSSSGIEYEELPEVSKKKIRSFLKGENFKELENGNK